jgi:hypothetical protein
MPDSYQADFGQRIGPNGELTYDFNGHVHATGLDLDAGTTGSPPDDRKIRWLRQADGGVAAQVYGYSAGGGDALALRAGDPATPTGLEISSVLGDREITALAFPQQERILDEQGRSDFVFHRTTGGVTRFELAWNAAEGTIDAYEAGVLVAQLAEHLTNAAPLNATDGAAPVGTFDLPRDNMHVALSCVATGFAPAANTTCHIDWFLDGVDVGASHIYINPANVHLTFPPFLHVRTDLAAGSHTIEPQAGAGTVRDFNDYASVLVSAL